MNLLEKRDTENKADQKRYILEIENLEKENTTLKAEQKKLTENLEVYKEKIPEMEAECEELRIKAEKAKAEFDNIDSRIQSEIEGTKTELGQLEVKKGKLRLAIQKENNQIERAKEIAEGVNLKQEENDKETISGNIEHEKDALAKLEDDYSKICEQFEKTNDRQIKEFEEKAEKAKEEKKEVQDKLIQVLNDIEEAKNGTDNLNAQNRILN